MTIVTFSELVTLRNKVAMVDGGFDPLHVGHIEYFKAAAKIGLPVLCCLASDNYIRTKHKPLMPEHYRAVVIDSIRYIDFVYVNSSNTADVLKQLQPRYYIKGRDWENRLPHAETAICNSLGIGIMYSDSILDSSSRLLREYLSQ